VPIPNSVPVNPDHEEWDVIVIGAGMGGVVAGFELGISTTARTTTSTEANIWISGARMPDQAIALMPK